MASKTLFPTIAALNVKNADMVNEAGGRAYRLSPEQALAQYAATGCLSATYYATAEEQLTTVLALCENCEPAFLARVAVYCREKGFMKDMPALLCAVLSKRAPGLLIKIFPRAIDNGKMLRNFVQIMRSGATGRRSLGTLPKKLVRQWLESYSDEMLFRASVGQSPSLADIVKMVHPKPSTDSRAALYAYLIGRNYKKDHLPELVRQYEAFKADAGLAVPDVPFQMLTSLELTNGQWGAIAQNAGWQMTRINLNTFARHGVFAKTGLFSSSKAAKRIAERLRNPEEIRRARVFPYQLMTAYTMTEEGVPEIVREALRDALEVAIENLPQLEGKVYVFPDVSDSMSSPVTGVRKGATGVVRCIDVAALVAAAILRRNKTAEVLPFECTVRRVRLNPRDSVMTNAQKLAAIGGGGTNCSAPLAELNRQKARGDLLIYVSDNESWIDSRRGAGATATMVEWQKFKHRNPAAKLVCIDLQPYATTQAQEREDILNIGGFSDAVFEVIADFAAGRLNTDHWRGVINKVKL